ncbi:MAG: metallopeptidase TldD-related protein [Desulfococcaceae bacterium]|nr:metallopeptidase TldD-related protein [Desulfococcaceae bacterium]
MRGSKQTGWKPTPLANPDSLILQGSKTENLHDCIRESESAFLVTSVLGLHTQDSGRGDYSLAVPHGIVIRNGEMCGSAKAVLSGNFFDDLQKEIITLNSPFHSFQGIAFDGKIH